MELSNYPCPNKTRYYKIEAIQIPIVYNKYGDHDPDGLLYMLKKDAGRIRQKAFELFDQEIPQPCDEVIPLVIRANLGDRIIISFSHSLNRPLSIHVQGLEYDVQTSDGANVGYNKDSTGAFVIAWKMEAAYCLMAPLYHHFARLRIVLFLLKRIKCIPAIPILSMEQLEKHLYNFHLAS